MEPRITIITLGVVDLEKSIAFYRDGLKFPMRPKDPEANIVFFELGALVFALYPLHELAADACAGQVKQLKEFSGITLAHNVASKEAVERVLEEARSAGANIVKPAQDVFWGGYSGYFTDLDGYYWEVAWNPFMPI